MTARSRVAGELADITRELNPPRKLTEHEAARIVFGARPWKRIPGRQPRAGASCTRPLCRNSARVMITRDGAHRPQSVCDPCASLLCAASDHQEGQPK